MHTFSSAPRTLRTLGLIAALTLPTLALSAEKILTVDLELGDGQDDNPMIVLWLETDQGEFVKTLTLLSQDKKYYNKLKTWWRAQEAGGGTLDGVVGPTLSFNNAKHLEFPVDGSGAFLSGHMILRIEQGRDHGPSYKKLAIPLAANLTQKVLTADENKDLGFLKSLTLAVKEK